MGAGVQRHVPTALRPGKRTVTHCTGGWVGPRWIRKISPPQAFDPRTVQPVVILLDYSHSIVRCLLLHTSITHHPVTFPWATGWTKAVTDSNSSTEKTLETEALRPALRPTLCRSAVMLSLAGISVSTLK